MKQHVYLYIDGAKADLTDDELILFTYSAEDSDNPSVVVNSYTKTVTLPATAANNAIFDHIIECTHNVRAGAFSPIVRTPFVIYSSTGETLEQGYLKLDSMTDKDGQRAYNVTLYGGMGGLLYVLMYRNGVERTLADLPFDSLTPPLADADIEFNINFQSVLAAWEDLCLNAGNDDRWGLFNFAPMYNGAPKSFDNKKVLATYKAVPGVTSTANADGYAPTNGQVLVTLPDETTEWRVRDLRSYLQRPVVNVGKILDAIVLDAAANGYTFAIDAAIATDELFKDLWMTLPMLSSRIVTSGAGGTVAVPSASVTLQYGIASGYIPVSNAGVPTNSKEESMTVNVGVTYTGSFTSGTDYQLNGAGSVRAVYLMQLVAYDATGAIAASKVVSISSVAETTTQIVQAIKAVSPNPNPIASDFVDVDTNAGDHFVGYPHATSSSAATLWKAANSPLTIPLSCTAYNATSWRVYVQRFMLNDESNYDVFFTSGGTSVQVRQVNTADGTDDWAEMGVMTNSLVTKDILLGSTMSPGSFLLALVRQYGLKLHYDAPTKTMTLMERGTYYDGTIVNIDGRIDHADERKTEPFVFQHRFFRWALQPSGQTAAKASTPYGGMTVDTLFPFDDETENVLDGVTLKTAADRLDRDIEYNLVQKSTNSYIPAFLKGGAKYTLFNGTDSKSYDVPTIDESFTITPLLPAFPSYDHYPKIDMRDADDFVLVRFCGRAADMSLGYGGDNLRITDDTPTMLSVNKGKPCWRFNYGGTTEREVTVTDQSTHVPGTSPLPLFNRIAGEWQNGTWVAWDCIEMAVPDDIDIPNVDTSALVAVYPRMWQSFVADRYDVDTRVLTCNVFWRGLRVDASALRKLYTFGGCVWCLTRIDDYSLTTERPTKCTFVKVKDADSYTGNVTPPPTPPTPPTPPPPPPEPQRVDLVVGEWTSSIYIHSRTGAESSTNATWSATNKIALGAHAPGNTLYFWRVERNYSNFRTGMAFYKSDGTFLSGQDPYVGSGNTMIDGSVEIPEGAVYAAFSCYTNSKQNFYAWYEYEE